MSCKGLNTNAELLQAFMRIHYHLFCNASLKAFKYAGPLIIFTSSEIISALVKVGD